MSGRKRRLSAGSQDSDVSDSPSTGDISSRLDFSQIPRVDPETKWAEWKQLAAQTFPGVEKDARGIPPPTDEVLRLRSLMPGHSAPSMATGRKRRSRFRKDCDEVREKLQRPEHRVPGNRVSELTPHARPEEYGMEPRQVLERLKEHGASAGSLRVLTQCMLGLQKGQCASCWMQRRACVCPKIRPVNLRHRVLLYLHNKEYAKGVNTGKFVVRATELADYVYRVQQDSAAREPFFDHLRQDEVVGGLEEPPVVSRMFLHGVERDEQELAEILRREAHKTVVLFPALDACMASEFFAQRLAEQEKAKGGLIPDESKSSPAEGGVEEQPRTPWEALEPQNIVLIDGTWSGVHGMHRRIPKNIPRVVIPLPEEDGGKEEEQEDQQHQQQQLKHTGQRDSLLNPARGQTREDGYATIEALAYLFQEMEAPKEVCDEFLRQCKVSIDHCRIQSGLAPVYQPLPEEQLNSMRVTAPNKPFLWDIYAVGPLGEEAAMAAAVMAAEAEDSKSGGEDEQR